MYAFSEMEGTAPLTRVPAH